MQMETDSKEILFELRDWLARNEVEGGDG